VGLLTFRKMNKNRTIYFLKVLAVSTLFTMVGCATFNEYFSFKIELPIYSIRPIKFSHAAHGKETEADTSCEDCHTKALNSEEAGMPSVKSCRNCHNKNNELEEWVKPFAPDGKKIMWTDVTQLPEEVIFSHKLHDERDVGCDECHPGIETSEAVSADFRNSKDDCIKCHAKEKMDGECKVCHESINKEFEPSSHQTNWKRFHGQVVKAGIEPPYENRCSICHTDQTCFKCHQDEEGKPQNHNNFWGQKSHGIAASMNRSSCATCHRSDSCDRCHQETAPRNHRGIWGAPFDGHCMNCHLSDQHNCAVCHSVQIGHKNAPAQPFDGQHLAPVTSCRNCHGSLRHPDNGDRCESCHR
jgi:Outer membrane cytochrome MtrC/MtrF-like, domains II/IV